MSNDLGPAALVGATMGRAAGALCSMISVDVDLGDVRDSSHPVPPVRVGVRLGLEGGLAGSIILLVPDDAMLSELLRVPPDLAESAIAEVGNIVGSHLMLGLEEATGHTLSITPPELTGEPATVTAWLAGADHAWVELQCLSPVLVVLVLD